MPMIAKCDICDSTVKTNAATDGVTSTRGKLTVKSMVVKSNGSDPIICARCVRLAVEHGE